LSSQKHPQQKLLTQGMNLLTIVMLIFSEFFSQTPLVALFLFINIIVA
jgi:hypothetical protein